MENFTTSELQAELDQRKKMKEAGDKPNQLFSKDFTQVIDYCQKYIDGIFDEDYPPKDMDHYIFEAAMNAVFGNDVWEWINARI